MDPQSFWPYALILNHLAQAPAQQQEEEENHPAVAPAAPMPQPEGNPALVEEYQPAEVPAPAPMGQLEEHQPAGRSPSFGMPSGQENEILFEVMSPHLNNEVDNEILFEVMSPHLNNVENEILFEVMSPHLNHEVENEILFEVMSPHLNHEVENEMLFEVMSPHLNNEMSYAGANQSAWTTPYVPCYASKKLYVEGLPSNCTRREVAHIFRRFSGFLEVNLIKESGHAGSYCFVNFATIHEARVALETLQGYEFDKQDPSFRLHIDFSL